MICHVIATIKMATSLPTEAKRQDFYAQLLVKAERLLSGQRDLIANLSNISSLLFHELRSHFGPTAVK